MFHNYLVKSKDKGHEDNNATSEIISTHCVISATKAGT